MGSALLLLPEAVCLTPASCPELFQEVSAKFKEIIREAEKSNYLADAWVSSAVIQIVLLLVRHNFEHTPRFTDVSFSSRREYMEKFTTVCQYIDTSFRENLTLEQAAEIAGFSKYHFSRLFKEFTGITFQEYPAATAQRAAADMATAIRSPAKFAAASAARASLTVPKSGRTAAPITAGAASPPPTKVCGAQTALEIPLDAASGGRSGMTSPWTFCGAR